MWRNEYLTIKIWITRCGHVLNSSRCGRKVCRNSPVYACPIRHCVTRKKSSRSLVSWRKCGVAPCRLEGGGISVSSCDCVSPIHRLFFPFGLPDPPDCISGSSCCVGPGDAEDGLAFFLGVFFGEFVRSIISSDSAVAWAPQYAYWEGWIRFERLICLFTTTTAFNVQRSPRWAVYFFFFVFFI